MALCCPQGLLGAPLCPVLLQFGGAGCEASETRVWPSKPIRQHALGLALALVQGIISAEWVLLTVIREGHPPLDSALICSYTLGLLLIAVGLSLGVVVLCGGELGGDGGSSEDVRETESEKRRWKCDAVWLFLSCLSSALLWVAWLGFYVYGSQALKAKAERLGKGENEDIRVLDEPALL